MKQKRIRLFSLLMAAVLLVAAESVLFASASSTPEAAINGAVYETIEEAIAAAVPGDMIELLTSINDGSRGLTFDKPLTLSLASCPDFVRLGYISATEDLTIQGPGTLWVQQALVNRQAGSAVLTLDGLQVYCEYETTVFEWYSGRIRLLNGTYFRTNGNTTIFNAPGAAASIELSVEEGSTFNIDKSNSAMEGIVTSDPAALVAALTPYLDEDAELKIGADNTVWVYSRQTGERLHQLKLSGRTVDDSSEQPQPEKLSFLMKLLNFLKLLINAIKSVC